MILLSGVAEDDVGEGAFERHKRRVEERTENVFVESTAVVVGAVVISIVEGKSGKQPLVYAIIGADRHRRKLSFVPILEAIVMVIERIRASRQKYARTRAQAENYIRTGASRGRKLQSIALRKSFSGVHRVSSAGFLFQVFFFRFAKRPQTLPDSFVLPCCSEGRKSAINRPTTTIYFSARLKKITSPLKGTIPTNPL